MLEELITPEECSSSLILYLISIFSISFSNFLNKYICSIFRFLLAKITGFIPFSLAELLIILLIPIATIAIIFLIRSFKKGTKYKIKFVFVIISVLLYIFSSFVLTFAPAYRGSSLDEKLNLEKNKVSSDELFFVSNILVSKLSEISKDINYGEDDFSVMPYSFKELNNKLNQAYKDISKKYDFIQDMSSSVKSIILSEPMTYTHISGVYTFFTGEANVNINYPNYVIPYTMAHEMAHQRGIAMENEANFIAFLVCINSDDPYIQYSAYFNMLEYFLNPLYSANKDRYKELINTVPVEIIKEILAYNKFFEKYRDNVASDISDKVNNSYLQSQGQESGVKSYGLVVDLCVAYYKAKENS